MRLRLVKRVTQKVKRVIWVVESDYYFTPCSTKEEALRVLQRQKRVSAPRRRI